MSDQPCSPPLRFLLLAWMLNPLVNRLLIYLAFCAQLVPLMTLFGLWQSHETGSDLFISGTIFVLIIPILRWDLLGVWLPYFYLALLFVITALLGDWLAVGLLATVLSLALAALRLYHRDAAITLQFPLKDGLFYTAHGGAYPLTNYHGAFVRAQRYALDLMQLNRWGTRALGFYPRRLERYSIYGTTVVSPGNGVVLRSVDGLPDLPPGQLDRTNAAGNHIVIRLDGSDVNLLLAHLKNGTVSVKIGDRVSTGQPIGKVGNSGNTTEPHLHIHAQKRVTKGAETEWIPVPIRFGSRWLVRNNLVVA